MIGKNDGGQASPRDKGLQAPGMTLRQYYMAHAPITLADAKKAMATAGAGELTGNDLIQVLAKMRAAYADAMIAEGSK